MKRRIDESAFWISYSDLSTGLLLIFILLLTQMSKSKQREQEKLTQENQNLVTERREFKTRNQTLKHLQQEISKLQEKVHHLLGVHERLSDRLSSAVLHTNRELNKDVFKFAKSEVYVSDQVVVWFLSKSYKLLPEAQRQLRIFYRNLYDALLRDVDGNLQVEPHLISITIEGHTDPLPIKKKHPLWSLSSYNGTRKTKHRTDSNFQLGQQRAKAIVDSIHDAYAERQPGFNAQRPWHVFISFVQASGRSWTRAYCATPPSENSKRLAVSESPLSPRELIAKWPSPCPIIEQNAQAPAHRKSRRVTFSFQLDTRALLENLRETLHSSSASSQAR